MSAVCHDNVKIYPDCFVLIMYTHLCIFFFTTTLSRCDYFVDPQLVAAYEKRAGKLAKDDMMLNEEEQKAGIFYPQGTPIE